ncbi:MAG: hypothetical protein ACKVOY_03890 [Burkholderiaceae bacterium]
MHFDKELKTIRLYRRQSVAVLKSPRAETQTWQLRCSAIPVFASVLLPNGRHECCDTPILLTSAKIATEKQGLTDRFADFIGCLEKGFYE